MVGVAQLVEHRIVAPGVVGSIPIVHPIFRIARLSLAFSFLHRRADVVKLVDTLDLGSSAARCESSSLSVRTISCQELSGRRLFRFSADPLRNAPHPVTAFSVGGRMTSARSPNRMHALFMGR